MNSHEIKSGVIYRDANVIVTAFPTKHALESYGYRFDAPDRSVGHLWRYQSEGGDDQRLQRL